MGPTFSSLPSLALLVLMAVGVTAAQEQPAQDSPAAPVRYSIPELVKAMSPTVVYIAAVNRDGRPANVGSGFIVHADGVIVTNYHLVEGAFGLQIKTFDREIYDRVEVLDYDIRRDVIVLKIRPYRPLHAVSLAEGDELAIGEDAAAIGNPQGLEHTVSAGIISGYRQAEGFRVIQTTVPISPGSSGGPLFNMAGDVVGITTAAAIGDGSQNLNFAIPVSYIRPLLESGRPPRPFQQLSEEVSRSVLAGARRTFTGPTLSVEASATVRVLHDHGRQFRTYCRGTLRVSETVVSFASDEGEEGWELRLVDVQDVGKNVNYGYRLKAFHIRQASGRNDNFALLGPDGQTSDPGEVIAAIRRKTP